MKISIRMLLVALTLLLNGVSLHAQGTAFTYQGRLTSGGNPANGSYDLEFSLRDALEAGSLIGNTNVFAPVLVSNGLFTVQLDFGASAFNGAARWIEMGVRTNGSASGYTILGPRQPVSSAPYAIQAANAAATTGNISDAQLSSNIPRLNGSPGFTGTANFNPSSGAPFAVGNANKVTNLNADLLDGLDAAAFWKLGGNGGTSPGTDFLGTTDNQALELKVNNQRGFRLEPTLLSGTLNLIGGSPNNSITPETYGATIAGGGGFFGANTIGSGAYNSTIGGGSGHSIGNDAFQSVIAGGANNQITARSSTVGGGGGNWILSAPFSTISGGGGNTISNANSATIPGGANNVAATDYTFAAGHNAQAIHVGSFVWSDSSSLSPFASSGVNQFLIRALGGVGINTNNPNGSALNVNGTVTATSFVGSFPGLSGNLTNTLNFAPASGPPFLVGNANRVINFNADLLDGLDSTNFWKLGGNSGTRPGTDFLGTTDNQALEFKVNGSRVLRLEPNANGPNVIGGYARNYVAPGVAGATISGGGYPGNTNSISTDYSTIAGGYRNTIQPGAAQSTISGGNVNTIQTNASLSTIGGGNQNTIQTNASASTIAGGWQNVIQIDAAQSTVGGGFQNTIQTGASESIIGGGTGNTIQTDAYRSTIGGGSLNTIQTNAPRSTIGGGYDNLIQANARDSTISGGYFNTIQNNLSYSTVGGGNQNTIQTGAYESAIGGGSFNTIQANGNRSMIGGGSLNAIQANGQYATIPGGRLNSAANYAFAAGNRAKANHTGTFVWGDSTDADVASTADNQFLIRAGGGVGINKNNPSSALDVAGDIRINDSKIWFRAGSDQFHGLGWYSTGTFAGGNPDGPVLFGCAGGALGSACSGQKIALVWDSNGRVGIGNTSPGTLLQVSNATCNGTTWANASDRNLKENFAKVDARSVLEKIVALPVLAWNYKNQPNENHVGPMAQDFYAAFNVGSDDKHITTVDEGGVALAAIQGLNQKLEERLKTKDREIEQLRNSMEELKKLVLKSVAHSKE